MKQLKRKNFTSNYQYNVALRAQRNENRTRLEQQEIMLGGKK